MAHQGKRFDAAIIRDLYDQNLTFTQIANEVGMLPESVRRIVRKGGFEAGKMATCKRCRTHDPSMIYEWGRTGQDSDGTPIFSRFCRPCFWVMEGCSKGEFDDRPIGSSDEDVLARVTQQKAIKGEGAGNPRRIRPMIPVRRIR